MIFVTVGTTEFDPLVQAADRLAAAGDDVVIQIGHGLAEPLHARWFRFAPDLDAWYGAAELVVTHGGLGTVTEVLLRRIPLVGVSNPDRYDRHQDQILGALEADGHLVWCRDLAELPEAVQRARHARFAPYQPPPSRVGAVIRHYLEGLPGRG